MVERLLWKNPLVAEGELAAGMEGAGEESDVLGFEMNAQGGEVVAGIAMIVEEGPLNALANDFVFIIKKFEKGTEMSLVGHASKMASSGQSAKEKGRGPSGPVDSVEFRALPFYGGAANE